MGRPLKARRSPFPDRLWMCDESSYIEGLFTFPLKFWQENSKRSSCQQSSLTKAFPVTQIHPNLNKIVSSCKRACHIAQICPNSHGIFSSSIRALGLAQICPISHKIVFSCITAFPVHNNTVLSHTNLLLTNLNSIYRVSILIIVS